MNRKAQRQTRRVLAALLVAVALWWLWSEREQAPDERLVAHMDATCAIAKSHVASPQKGVRELFAYLGENSPQMLHEVGELLVTIERIADDTEHDERARKAAERLHEAGRRCEAHWERFLLAVERDPGAKAELERGVERLSRTLEILFGGGEGGALPGWGHRLTSG